MNAADLGVRFRRARELRHLSQQSIAEALDISRSAVSQIESGNRSVSTLELVRFSQFCLVPVTELLDQGPASVDGDVTSEVFRMVPELENDPTMRLQMSLCLHLCREGEDLKSMLSVGAVLRPPFYQLRDPRTSGEAVAQGEHVAIQERNRLELGNAPVMDIPALVISQGIWASGVALPVGTSGIFIRHNDVGMATLVNASHSKGRGRLSLAHEYAHALIDRNRGIMFSQMDDMSEFVEQRANAFASEFLIPSSGVRAFLEGLGKGQPSRVDRFFFETAGGGHFEATQRPPVGSQRISYKDCAMLANEFGVTYTAAAIRLKSLQFISDDECESILDHERFGRMYLKALGMFSELGKRELQQYRDRELRNKIAHLAIEAHRRGKVPDGHILELSKPLRIPGDTLLNLSIATIHQ